MEGYFDDDDEMVSMKETVCLRIFFECVPSKIIMNRFKPHRVLCGAQKVQLDGTFCSQFLPRMLLAVPCRIRSSLHELKYEKIKYLRPIVYTRIYIYSQVSHFSALLCCDCEKKNGNLADVVRW